MLDTDYDRLLAVTKHPCDRAILHSLAKKSVDVELKNRDREDAKIRKEKELNKESSNGKDESIDGGGLEHPRGVRNGSQKEEYLPGDCQK